MGRFDWPNKESRTQSTGFVTKSGNRKGKVLNVNSCHSLTSCRASSMWWRPAFRDTDRERWREDEINICAVRVFKEYGPRASTCKERFLSVGFYLLTRACMRKKCLGEGGLGGACCSKLIRPTFTYRVCKTQAESNSCNHMVGLRCSADGLYTPYVWQINHVRNVWMRSDRTPASTRVCVEKWINKTVLTGHAKGLG